MYVTAHFLNLSDNVILKHHFVQLRCTTLHIFEHCAQLNAHAEWFYTHIAHHSLTRKICALAFHASTMYGPGLLGLMKHQGYCTTSKKCPISHLHYLVCVYDRKVNSVKIRRAEWKIDCFVYISLVRRETYYIPSR